MVIQKASAREGPRRLSQGQHGRQPTVARQYCILRRLLSHPLIRVAIHQLRQLSFRIPRDNASKIHGKRFEGINLILS